MGTQKGGTTALDAYLREHPAIFMASRKEVHFFDDEERFPAADSPDYTWYHQFFSNAPAHAILGETTPIYMYWRPAPARIRQYNPDAKLIAVLRNPITRAYSHWNMEYLRKSDRLPFWDALQAEAQRCKEAFPLQHRVYSYVERGYYSRQLERIWGLMPRHNTLLIRHEVLKNEVQTAIDGVCDFLGVDRFRVRREINAHSLPYTQPMTRREWDFLANIFEDEVRQIERITGWNCGDWLRYPSKIVQR
jgi:hypothetical protein